MGWENSQPIFCTAMEKVVDLENTDLRCNNPYRPHKLDNRVEVVVISDSGKLHPALVKLIRDPYLKRHNKNPAAYMDVFLD